MRAAWVVSGLWLWTGGAELRPGVAEDALSVRWFAPFFSGGGYCSEATAFVSALSKVVEVTVEQHGDSLDRDYIESQRGDPAFDTVVKLAKKRSESPDVVICHSEPGAWHVLGGPAWQSSPCPPRTRRGAKAPYVVGRTMFETDRLPHGWPARLNAVDEVWVPTSFHKRIFEAAGVHKVFVVGEPVDVDRFTPEGDKLEIQGVSDDSFVVLSVFKWEARKGWDILIRGWFEAFTFGPNCPTLVLVTNAYHSEGNFMDKLAKFVEEDLKVGLEALCPIQVLSKLPPQDLEALYRRADVMALPTRGEKAAQRVGNPELPRVGKPAAPPFRSRRGLGPPSRRGDGFGHTRHCDELERADCVLDSGKRLPAPRAPPHASPGRGLQGPPLGRPRFGGSGGAAPPCAERRGGEAQKRGTGAHRHGVQVLAGQACGRRRCRARKDPRRPGKAGRKCARPVIIGMRQTCNHTGAPVGGTPFEGRLLKGVYLKARVLFF